jgi:hypothetical protein
MVNFISRQKYVRGGYMGELVKLKVDGETEAKISKNLYKQ